MTDDFERKEYFCVWDKKVKCKILTEYKLRPESLVLFCRVCKELPLHKAKS